MNTYDLMFYINTGHKDYSQYPVVPRACVISGGPNNEEKIVIRLVENSDYKHEGVESNDKIKMPSSKIEMHSMHYNLPIFADLSIIIDVVKREVRTKIGNYEHVDFYDPFYDNKLARLTQWVFSNVFAGVELFGSALFFADINEQEDPITGLDTVDLGVFNP